MTHFDAICIGETMVALVPEDARPISGDSRMALRVAGAESNVATSLARLGHSVRWVSAVGADPFGEIITRELGSAGVELGAVGVASDAPTGIFAKNPAGESTRVHYYRKGSGASRMTPDVLAGAGSARLVHVSGITPALSDGCRALTRALVAERALGDAIVSFDVNYRPALWRGLDDAATVLAELARRADIVFVGRDEAEELWGTATAEAVREFLPEPRILVVKDAAIEAVSFEDGEIVRAPSLRVEVVEPVGAGDAFAAGWLSGLLSGRTPRERLRLGHLLASRAVQIVGDCPVAPTADEIQIFLTEE
ncbi:carbohydrate kinase [Microbacterium nanhaiense]|uniref:Carbohydrate kinase n=1 Tax=Microbacterium nanhaiense TaxID=1301026 RepID=A0ABQ2N1C9_9MICO|nr:sugar kinase [Microbacterium nanhaiense]GGO64936.1 carbohydrate kinase [Microbacterium nanhaiense]